jgi:hypothetical protein
MERRTLVPRTLRVAGRPLQALARLLGTPVAGRRVAEMLMRERVLDKLRLIQLPDSEARPVVVFRAAPRHPEQGDG